MSSTNSTSTLVEQDLNQNLDITNGSVLQTRLNSTESKIDEIVRLISNNDETKDIPDLNSPFFIKWRRNVIKTLGFHLMKKK